MAQMEITPVHLDDYDEERNQISFICEHERDLKR